MAYEFESRVRYSELDADKVLSLSALVNYFQDCSTFQSESLARGFDYLESHHRVWMVLSWQIEILRKPKLGEKVTAATWPHGFKAFFGYRNFVLKDAQGEVLAKADSLWAYIDTETGKPTKILPEDIAGYGNEMPLDMEAAPRKIQIPEGGVKMEPVQVVRSQLDSNYHVNNGQYIRMAQEYLPEGFEVGKLQVEYRSQAKLHDVIVPVVHTEADVVTVSLNDEAGKPYAVIVWKKKEADLQQDAE